MLSNVQWWDRENVYANIWINPNTNVVELGASNGDETVFVQIENKEQAVEIILFLEEAFA